MLFVQKCHVSSIFNRNDYFFLLHNVTDVNTKRFCINVFFSIILQQHFSNLPKTSREKVEAVATVTVEAVREMRRLHAQHQP